MKDYNGIGVMSTVTVKLNGTNKINSYETDASGTVSIPGPCNDDMLFHAHPKSGRFSEVETDWFGCKNGIVAISVPDANVYNPNWSYALGSPENPIPQNSPTPADQAWRLKAGDPNVVSNAPVPDTPANRLKDGPPLSHSGRASAAASN